MIARLAALCAIEAAIVVLLAVQVFGATPAPAVPAAAAPAAGAAPGAPAPQPRAAAAEPLAAPPGAAAGDAATPARETVAAKWKADDAVGVLLTGSLHDRDGEPVQAMVSAKLDQITLATSSTADGSYALAGLRPGEWAITLRGTGIVESMSTIEIGDGAVQHRDFTVDASFAVRVTIVTPDGADATMALRTSMFGFGDFVVAGQRDRFPDRLAATDYGRVFVGDAEWNGEMNPKDGFAGTLHLTALPAHVALLQRHLVLQQQRVQPGQQQVKFVVDVGALKALAGAATVRVLDADSGAPLTTARVELNTSNRGGGGAKVDADGRAIVEGLSPGLLRCHIRVADHEDMYTTVRIEPGQRLDLGDVRLGKALPLQGTVLDGDGKPASANLAWTELKWRRQPTAAFATNRTARTAADGTFSLWGTGRGAIAVAARDQQGNVAMGVFDNPAAEPVVLRLAKACDCVVTRPADPTRAFTVTLFDGARRAIAGRTLDSRSVTGTIRLAAGQYSYEVHDEQERMVQSGTVTCSATPCTVEIR